MSGAPVLVDVEIVARRVVAEPKRARVSTHEQHAMALWLVRQLSIAEAVALFLEDHRRLQQLAAESGHAPESPVVSDAAFNTLKTLFEQEFPNDGSIDSL